MVSDSDMTSVITAGRPRADHSIMEISRDDRLAQVRQKHLALRADLRELGAALEKLELRGDVTGVAAVLNRVGEECRDHFPREEALARRAGPGAGRVGGDA
jgi:hypothetical protein